MAKIVDLDLLIDDTEIVIDTTAKTIQLLIAGNLSNDGVTLQCIYSWLKMQWKDNNAYIKFDFPIVSITNEQFEIQNGWDFADQTTKDLIRDGGWAKVDSGISEEEYMNITTLGSFDDSGADLAYYLQNGITPENIVLTGPVNQAVKIYGDATHDDFDYRTSFQIFLREQGKTYAFGDLIVDQSITALTYKKYALPLSNGSDLKINESDVNIDGNTPYTGMSITWGAQAYDIGGNSRDFSVVIDGNNGTAEEIYEFVQRQLRNDIDIDDGAGDELGNITDELLVFIGDTLKTKRTSAGGGVYIDNFQATDTNRLVFVDDLGIERTYPYVASGQINFNDNIQNDTSAKYWMFFTNDLAADTPTSKNFGTALAIIVDDNGGTPITGTVGGSPNNTFDYDYDGNVQRGAGSEGKNVPVTLVAQGTDTAQYVKATGTIYPSNANNFSLVAALERNYINPA